MGGESLRPGRFITQAAGFIEGIDALWRMDEESIANLIQQVAELLENADERLSDQPVASRDVRMLNLQPLAEDWDEAIVVAESYRHEEGARSELFWVDDPLRVAGIKEWQI